MWKMKNQEFVNLLKRVATYNSPMTMNRRGYYKANNGDIILISPLFVIRIKNLDIVDMPPESYYAICFDEIQAGPQEDFYPMPLDYYARLLEIPNELILSSTIFSTSSFTAKLKSLTPLEQSNSRVVFSELQIPEDMKIINFQERDGSGKAIKVFKSGTTLSASSFETKDGEEILLNVPYLVGNFRKSENGQVIVDVMRRRAKAEAGILTSKGVWFPDNELFTTAHFPPSLVEPAIRHQNNFRDKGYNFCFHSDATLLHDLLDVFELTKPLAFRLDIPDPAVHPVKIFNARKGGQMLQNNEAIVNRYEAQKLKVTQGDVCQEPLFAVLRQVGVNEDSPDISIAFSGLCYSVSGPQGR